MAKLYTFVTPKGEFNSIAEAARTYDVSNGEMRSKFGFKIKGYCLKNKLTGELEYYSSEKTKKNYYLYKGDIYTELVDICKATGFSKSSLMKFISPDFVEITIPLGSTPCSKVLDHPSCIPVEINGVTYPSIGKASVALGISGPAIRRCIKNGKCVLPGKFDSSGKYTRAPEGKPKVFVRTPLGNFPSLRAASIAHKMSYQGIISRLRSGKFPDYQIISEEEFLKTS